MSQRKALNGKSLELKFQSTISTNWTSKTRQNYVPVSCSIPNFLQSMYQMIIQMKCSESIQYFIKNNKYKQMFRPCLKLI